MIFLTLVVVILFYTLAANVNSKNVRGLNPLELATHNNHSECIAILSPHTNMPSQSSGNGGGGSGGGGGTKFYGGPQTPKGQQAMRQVYHEQASMDYQPHNGWGGMSERGAQSASTDHGGMQVVARSERAGYDSNVVDPGLARLMAAVSTPGRSVGEEEEEGGEAASKLESIVSMGGGETMDPTLLRLAAAVASPNKQRHHHHQQQQQQHSQQQRHWISCLDPASGAAYYKDIITGHTQWDPPSEVVNKEWKYNGSVWMNVRTNVTSSTPG
jgi:hypothetical protein